MKKICGFLPFFASAIIPLSGCSLIGQKSMSISAVYGFTTILSLLVLIGYTCFTQKKDNWFFLLFASVFVVNSGYFTLSISTVLNEALLANRISYLGSVFLPLAMLMLIINACNLKYKKCIPIILSVIGTIVFIIAASPGYLDIYYKSVTLVNVNGVSTLNKLYGDLHSIYLYYLLSYFVAMIGTIVYATVKKKVKSNIQALVLLMSVFINIGVWLLEQLVNIDFEFLSVSYIATELFLLCIYAIYKEKEQPTIVTNVTKVVSEASVTETKSSENIVKEESIQSEEQNFTEKCEYFVSQLDYLTPTERAIYNLYLEKKTTKEILDILRIKENTLKYHNKNLYSKLGVSSRKQLFKIATAITKHN